MDEKKEVMARMTGKPIKCECCGYKPASTDSFTLGASTDSFTLGMADYPPQFREERKMFLCGTCNHLSGDEFAATWELKHTKKGTEKIVDGKDIKSVYVVNNRYESHQVTLNMNIIRDGKLSTDEIRKMMAYHKFRAVKDTNYYHLFLVEE
jgi:hypothetical protein